MKFFSIIPWIILLLNHRKSSVAINYSSILDQIVENTFRNYKCLYVYIHNTYDIQRQDVLKGFHRTNFSILLFSTFDNVDENCGFIFLSKDVRILYSLEKATFNGPIRIAYVCENAEEILTLYKNKPAIFQDYDVLLVNINERIASRGKTRHDLEMVSVDTDFRKPFFLPKNHKQRKRINYKKRIIRISTFNCPIFNSLNQNGTELVDGVETRILKEIVNRLNLTVTLVVSPNNERWGTVLPNKTITGGILRFLQKKQADVGICSLWIESTKYPYINMSPYWEVMCLRFLIPKPEIVSMRWSSIFKPLSANLWSSLLLATIFISGLSSTLRHAERYLLGKSSPINFGLLSEYINIIGILVMAQNPEKHYVGSASQSLLLWWSLFALIITTLYSSSLVSHLTYPEFESMIDTVEGLVKAGFYWGSPYDPPTGHIFQLNNAWHKEFANRHQRETDSKDRIKNILAGNYAVFVKCVGEKHFMELDEIPVNILYDLRTPRKCMNYFTLAFGYRKTLPYTEMANRIISTLVESGITKYWLSRLFEKLQPSIAFEKIYEYKTPPEDIQLKALSLENLQAVFALLVTGIVLATLVFIGEWIVIINKRKQN